MDILIVLSKINMKEFFSLKSNIYWDLFICRNFPDVLVKYILLYEQILKYIVSSLQLLN